MDHHNSPEALLDRLDGLLAATEAPASPPYGEDLNDSEYTVQYDQFRQVKVFIRKLTTLYPVWPTRLGNVTVTQSSDHHICTECRYRNAQGIIGIIRVMTVHGEPGYEGIKWYTVCLFFGQSKFLFKVL